MSKLALKYLIFTFSIMLVCWGTCVLCSLGGMSLLNNYLMYIPYFLGGFSPTVASFIAIKSEDRTKSLKEWLSDIFDVKQNILSYLIVFAFCVLFIVPQCIISGFEKGAPLVAIFFMIPMMLFGGGLEEAGWRYILQPELEKKLGFIRSTLLVSVIWWIWHLPLFFIQGTAQQEQNYLFFGINVLGLSFALACIRKITGSVWLCVLFHCIVNSLSGIYIVGENIFGNIASAMILIVVSLFIVKLFGEEKTLPMKIEKKGEKENEQNL